MLQIAIARVQHISAVKVRVIRNCRVSAVAVFGSECIIWQIVLKHSCNTNETCKEPSKPRGSSTFSKNAWRKIFSARQQWAACSRQWLPVFDHELVIWVKLLLKRSKQIWRDPNSTVQCCPNTIDNGNWISVKIAIRKMIIFAENLDKQGPASLQILVPIGPFGCA